MNQGIILDHHVSAAGIKVDPTTKEVILKKKDLEMVGKGVFLSLSLLDFLLQ